MMIIYKFPLQVHGDVQMVRMPAGARVLSVQTQREEPMVWALVNTDQNEIGYMFKLVATGSEIPQKDLDLFEYKGTIQLSGGAFVFHVWSNCR